MSLFKLSKRQASFVNYHMDNIKRMPFQYNHPWVHDRNGMKNPYMRPDRRVRPSQVKWWFHAYVPVYGQVVQRLAPSEQYVCRPWFYDLRHKLEHNFAKYGPVFLVGIAYVLSLPIISDHLTQRGWEKTRLGYDLDAKN